MHIEVQKRGKKKFYYLATSYREGDRVRKVRQYLGFDHSKKDLKRLRPPGEKALLDKMAAQRRISDPLHTILNPTEKEALDDLIGGGKVYVGHLSDKEWAAFAEEFTYDTNAIEGSTVSASEVRDILEKDNWPAERTKWEIAETYGVAEAIGYMRKTDEHVSLELIKKLHEIVFANSKGYAGYLRSHGEEVVVADARGEIVHRGAPQKSIVPLLKELARWYEQNCEKYHAVVLAAVVHNQFENIHPFRDGNGRVGRLMLNNILLKHDLPPVNIRLEDRREYYSTLRAYENEGNLRPSIELILRRLRATKKK